ncbi:hypothetical protein D3C79_634290 [compost metagenome]
MMLRVWTGSMMSGVGLIILMELPDGSVPGMKTPPKRADRNLLAWSAQSVSSLWSSGFHLAIRSTSSSAMASLLSESTSRCSLIRSDVSVDPDSNLLDCGAESIDVLV